MIRKVLLFSLVFSLVVAAQASFAQTAQLLPATFSDLQPQQLVSSRAALPSINNNREAVQFSWPVTSTSPLSVQQQPHLQQSREHWLDVSSHKLAVGVDISTTAAGAIVRISPMALNGTAVELAMQDISLSIQGNRLNAGQGIESLANQQSLNAAGASFSDGTVAFRLSETVGFGNIKLQVATAAGVSDQFVVHVFEPNSPAVLNLQANRSNYLAGNSLRATVSLQGIAHQMSASDIQGYLSSPDASISIPVQFVANRNGGFNANAQLPMDAGNINGLWSVHALVNTRDANGLSVIRDAKTALAVAAPTARLNNLVSINASPDSSIAGGLGKGLTTSATDSMEVLLGIDAAIAGRYEISGVLYGTAKNGQLQPMAVAQSAAWLNQGQGQLALGFGDGLLKASGFSAPYAIRDVRLKDQSRLSLLQTRQQGLGVNL